MTRFPAIVPIVLIASLSPALHAQATSTTGALLERLSALERENARLQAQLLMCPAAAAPRVLTVVPDPPTDQPQTLAGASEAAKKIDHQRAPVSTAPHAAPGAAPVALGKDQAYWVGRLQPLREKLGSDLHSADSVEENLDSLKARVVPNAAGVMVFGPEILRVGTELTHWTAVIRDDLAAIAALEEEGRRAGALPDWLR